MAALFWQIGRGEVDGDVFIGEAEADGMKRVANPLPAFSNGLVG